MRLGSNFSKIRAGKVAGYAMLIAGFLMILANALGYLLGWSANLMPMFIIGLALVVVGMGVSARA